MIEENKKNSTLFNIIRNNPQTSSLFYIKETKDVYVYVEHFKYNYFFNSTVNLSEFLDYTKDKINTSYQDLYRPIYNILLNVQIFETKEEFEIGLLGSINPPEYEYTTEIGRNCKRLMYI